MDTITPRRMGGQIVAVGALGLLPLLLTGCGDIGKSLQLSNAVLVKMPGGGKQVQEPLDCAHWHFRHVLEGPKEFGRVNHWYVAWDDQKKETKTFGKPYWSIVFEDAPEIVAAAHEVFHADPLLIEPNHTFRYKPVAKPPAKTDVVTDPHAAARTPPGPPEVTYRNLPSPSWPDVRTTDPKSHRMVINPFWYLGDKYSELAKARDAVGRPLPGERIRIGHLDNGLDADHPGTPKHLVGGDPWSNAYGLLKYEQDLARWKSLRHDGVPPKKPCEPDFPEKTGGTHGMGTIGLLAGGAVHLPEKPLGNLTIAGYDKPIGGAPEAEVYPMRIAPWVASLSTGELAYAIDRASRVKKCDVISMSHGGSPSQAWVDAVNAAYDRGTAMIAAESDFLTFSFNPLPTWGIVVPSSPVYPAAFRRVLGVTGVTSERTSYGKNNLWRLLAAPTHFKEWAFRGSYGADGTSTVFFRPQHYPDGSELKRGGPLRPQPIAAYSPNVPWLAVDRSNPEKPRYVVDLDGAGTSASTPQVAAAAALWLQKHRHEFTPREWHGWQKAEAVYCALLETAEPRGTLDRPDPFLGAGLLKANRALGLSYSLIKQMKRPPGPECEQGKHDPGRALYFAKSGRDHFDAQRSFLALLGFDSLRNLPYDQRADLFQAPVRGATHADSLRLLYYNTLLLRAWQGGHLPDKYHGRDKFWVQADHKVGQALKGYQPMRKKDLLIRVNALFPPPKDSVCPNQYYFPWTLPGFPPE